MSTRQIISQKKLKAKTRATKKLLVLAIETSCDETAISVLSYEKNIPTILSSEVSSQIKLHAKWGGVVPNLAAREHTKNIDHVLATALAHSNIVPTDIDFISVTQGPGLIPALLVGGNYAKTLAYLWEKPLLGIHHIEGHIYANFISDKISASSNNQKTNSKKNPNAILESKIKNLKSALRFPILCLVVSGGHTQLALMIDHLEYEIIGQTVDDAVGEAFDKVARILGIGYPGGPAVATWAAKHKTWNMEHAAKFQNPNNQMMADLKANEANSYKLVFPRPMLNKQNFNFSFSGLKTAVLYETKKHLARNASQVSSAQNKNSLQNNCSRSDASGPDSFDKKYIAEVCHEFQQACVDVLVAKTIKAAEKYQPKTILLAGGVSANTELRTQLGQALEKNMPHVSYCIPELELTGDNAAMIGAAAAFRWEKMSAVQKEKALSNWKTLQPNANLKMK